MFRLEGKYELPEAYLYMACLESQPVQRLDQSNQAKHAKTRALLRITF